jgi:hypothetical protein
MKCNNIWQPESFVQQIRPYHPPHLDTFIERAEPLLDNYWLACIAALLSRDSMVSDSETERCRLTYRAAILERIIKLRWNSSFNANLRLPKKVLGIFKLESELWNCAIDLMLELSLISPVRYTPTPIWFTHCLMEGSLGAFTPQADKKIDYRKILQSGNQALKASTNPFDPTESPYTWRLIEDSCKLAERNDQFRKQKYTPLRQAREKLVAHLIYTPAQIITEEALKKRRPLKRPHTKGFQT